MDEFSENCGFIMTANWVNRIIEPLQSRAVTVTFSIPKAEAKTLAMEYYTKICGILEAEGVTYVKAAVGALIQKYYPDWRKIVVELQHYAASGHIDAGAITIIDDTELRELVSHLKAKDFSLMRSWVGKNAIYEVDEIYRKLYDSALTFVKPEYVPQLIVLLAKYQYQNAFATDREINLVACLTEIMVDIDFK
jgi:DNA polymerase III delta prime subunit